MSQLTSPSSPATQPVPKRSSVIRDALDGFLAFVSGAIGLLDVAPRLGYLPVAVAAFYFLYAWAFNDTSRPLRVWKAVKGSLITAFYSIKDWWQLALGLVGLTLCVVFQVIGVMPIYWKDANYLHDHKALAIDKIDSASEIFAAGSATSNDARNTKQREMEEWKYWMATGIPGNNIVYIETPEFDDDYASFTASVTLDSNYKVQRPYSFLQLDRPEFDNDPDYRPVLRQMDARTSRNGNSISVGVELPRKGERVILFFQAQRSDDKSLNPKQCLLNNYMEIRKK